MIALLAMPGTASASTSQFSILQEDRVLLVGDGKAADEAMKEAKAIGADYIRSFLVWSYVAPEPRSRVQPAGFDASDPASPGYDWSRYDALVSRARSNGLKLFLTLAPAMPYWGSEQPSRCPHRVGGYRFLEKSCHWKPSPRRFAEFARAAALRYGPDVEYWSIWNEPNLEHYLFPQVARSGRTRYDFAARRYRELFIAGQSAIAAADPDSRAKVLFGETAAISSPIDTLYGALCLDPSGRPFKGRMRVLMGCRRPHRLPIGGFAVHPYNGHASGTVFTRSFSGDGLPPAYMHRLHRVARTAQRHRRIPRGRGFFMTEAGFQSNPPDRRWGLSLRRHAAALNESDRLFWADPRVRAVAQFELYDVHSKAREPEGADVYTTGLRTVDGVQKPAWFAYRMPLVVTRLRAGLVEIWGQVRPADGRTDVSIDATVPGRPWQVAASARTNAAGYFRIRFRRRGAARLVYRSAWSSPGGEEMFSRDAFAGRRIRYRR